MDQRSSQSVLAPGGCGSFFRLLRSGGSRDFRGATFGFRVRGFLPAILRGMSGSSAVHAEFLLDASLSFGFRKLASVQKVRDVGFGFGRGGAGGGGLGFGGSGLRGIAFGRA